MTAGAENSSNPYLDNQNGKQGLVLQRKTTRFKVIRPLVLLVQRLNQAPNSNVTYNRLFCHLVDDNETIIFIP